MRIVSLLPSATEIVFALDRGDDLVGVTFECDHPPVARSRRVVSTSALPERLSPAEIDAVVSARRATGEDLYHLDERALEELRADVNLTQDLCAVCAVDVDRIEDALTFLGCEAEVVTLDPSSLDEVLASIETVGEVLGARDRATGLVGDLRRRLDAAATRLEGATRPPVLVLEWTDPPFGAGHWVPDLVTAGGGDPVLARPGRDSVRLDRDAVVAAPLEVVLVAPCGYHLDGAADLARGALDEGLLPPGAAVWAVDADSSFVRPGPRVVDGVETVARILHPDRCGAPSATEALRLA
jgi:iron complex transport system substrate-binding protein